MSPLALLALGLLIGAPDAPAPLKEPTYSGKPGYLLIQFGPKAERVWLVRDGAVLYVDRNGNGDLTEPGERVMAEKSDGSDDLEFKVGDVSVGGRTHKELLVGVLSLARYAQSDVGKLPAIKAALAADAKAEGVIVRVEADTPGLKGSGTDGRSMWMAGFHDSEGVLRFESQSGKASVVHIGGPLSVTFYSALPQLRPGRQADTILTVGTTGRGPGSFAMLAYEDTIPKEAFVALEVDYPAGSGAKPFRERYELKQRC